MKSKKYHLGVEWVGDQLRAGLFDERWRMVGKVARSAKIQRGPGEVLKRMARCALDAVDEADRQPEDVVALAILTDSLDAGQTWGPQHLNQLAAHLPPKLGSNLLTAGRVATIMWAVHEHELFGSPRSLLGLFSEPKPALYVADRTQPGSVKSLADKMWKTDGADLAGEESACVASNLLAAVRSAQPEVLLLVGPEYEDAAASSGRRVYEFIRAAGLSLPLHTPAYAGQAGVWAAARLAARTFGVRST